MAMDDCPLPEVAAALSPFIKPRDEVASIRRDLQTYLQSELQSGDNQLSSLSLTGSDLKVTHDSAGSLTGVRKAYWKALQAHCRAQEKYDALRAELDQIKHGKNTATASENLGHDASNDGYINLLRQREKHRKLKVIDRALSNISPTDSRSSIGTLDDIAKSKSSDAPVPPSSQLSLNRNPEVDAKLMELKKAIVSTKRRAEEQRARVVSPPVDGTDRPASQSEVAGLQKALQVLTVWMEDQLTLIASSEAETQSSLDEQTANGIDDEQPLSMSDIEKLYEQYLEARQRLIDTVSDESSDSNTGSFSFDDEESRARSLDGRGTTKSSAEILLPFMPTLLVAKQEEQALLQQSSHNRRQMAIAEDEMANIIRRFAGESHLVQPGAAQGNAWTAAAREAGAATERFIQARVGTGEQAPEKAKDTLHNIQSLPESLQNVAT